MTHKVLLIKGDGIGPEIMDVAVTILNFINTQLNLNIEIEHALLGGDAIDNAGSPYPDQTQRLAQQADAILLAAVGGSKWDDLSYDMRPEQGLLNIRKDLNLFANLRPIKTFNSLLEASSLKRELVQDLDIMIVRELTGGIYFGEQGQEHRDDGRFAYSVDAYSESEIVRITKVAIDIAAKRQGAICSVDKANVLQVSQLWRQIVEEQLVAHPKIVLTHQYIDNAAMQLVREPNQFDVILTSNLFGDILSDEAAMLTGSIGMLPSACLDENGKGMFEPCHGSAPDIAGKHLANPLAIILSIAMMMRYSLGYPQVADMLETSIERVLDAGIRTADISDNRANIVKTEQMGQAVLESLKEAI